jgi:hypothetical protein
MHGAETVKSNMADNSRVRRDSDRSIDSTKMDANTEYAAFYRCVPVPCAYRLFAPPLGSVGRKGGSWEAALPVWVKPSWALARLHRRPLG